MKQPLHNLSLGILSSLLLGLGLSAGDSGTAAPQRDGGPELKLKVDPNPPRSGPSQLQVLIHGPDGTPVNARRVSIEAGVGHPGMAPLRAQTRQVAAGTYEAPFTWTMPGDWQMTVTAFLDDGSNLAREFDYTVGAPQHGGGEAGYAQRVANHGSAVHILSPRDGARFAPGEEVRVEIATDNFVLGDQGNHWHVYIDGVSAQMIMGKINDAVLRDLLPGPHQISAYLSIGTHQEMQRGAAVRIEVMGRDNG